jgi:hypothetical protein
VAAAVLAGILTSPQRSGVLLGKHEFCEDRFAPS